MQKDMYPVGTILKYTGPTILIIDHGTILQVVACDYIQQQENMSFENLIAVDLISGRIHGNKLHESGGTIIFENSRIHKFLEVEAYFVDVSGFIIAKKK